MRLFAPTVWLLIAAVSPYLLGLCRVLGKHSSLWFSGVSRRGEEAWREFSQEKMNGL